MLKDTTAEMKNTVENINSRLEDSEEWIKRSGRQGSGNFPNSIGKRKKEFIK